MSVLSTIPQSRSELALHVERMQSEAERVITIKEKAIFTSVPVKDDLGQICRWEYENVPCGFDVHFRETPSAELIEFIKKPASDTYIAKTLNDLSAHKPYARGAEFFAVIVRDLVQDLKGYSHWAIKKTCEKFRRDPDTTFFPDTAQFIKEVRDLHDQIKWLGENTERYPDKSSSCIPAHVKPQRIDPHDFRSKRNVNRMVKLAMKPKGNWSKWEKRFMDAIGRLSK